MPEEEPTRPAEAHQGGAGAKDLQAQSPSKANTRLILAAVATAAALLGPITAWINGHGDRELQLKKAQDELSLRQMDLLLERSRSVEERRIVLKFLKETLGAEDPAKAMLRMVEDELATIDRVRELERELEGSQHREAVLESKYQQSTAQLEEERQERERLQRELLAERKRGATLQQELREERTKIGARIEEERPATFDEELDAYFAMVDVPEDEESFTRKAARLCHGFGGAWSWIYFGPNQPGVSCRVGGELVILDGQSLEPRSVRAPWFVPGAPQSAYRLCAEVGGSLASNPMSIIGRYLCRLRDSRGVIVEVRRGY